MAGQVWEHLPTCRQVMSKLYTAHYGIPGTLQTPQLTFLNSNKRVLSHSGTPAGGRGGGERGCPLNIERFVYIIIMVIFLFIFL